MKRLYPRPLGPLTFGNMVNEALESWDAMVTKWNKEWDDYDVGPRHSSWKIWEFGFLLYVIERVAHGPREPAWVWTGGRWICSEMELSTGEKQLMDKIAAKCPGGLAGWS